MIDFNTAIDLTDVPVEEWRTKYIGPGYRSCCSMTDEQNNGVIILFGYDLVGNPKTFICPHRCHIKYNVNYVTDEKDIFDNYVETRYFKNTKERKKYIDQVKDAIHIIECFSPASEFLHEMFDDVALDEKVFNTQDLRVFFLDIETVVTKQFEYPKTARNPINMLTIYDTLTKKYYTWTTIDCEKDFQVEPLKNMDPNMFELRKFDSEFFMLEDFLDWWESNYPDIICGYNSQSFDNPYLIRRLENVLGKENTKRISPIGRYLIKKNNLDNERANKQAEILVSIDGIGDCDTLILYRDKFKVKSPLDGGYSLNNVGEAEELGKKIEYEGSLKDLYEKEPNKFYEYNVRDVDLLRRIEEKCKLLPLARSITSSGLCNFDTIYSSISYLIGSLTMFAKVKMNKVMISYQSKKVEKLGKYEGAYVFPPIPGRYEGGIITVDFNSLYPNTIRSVNISPETTIGHLQEEWFIVSNPNDPLDNFDDHPVLSETQNFHLNLKNGKLFSKVIKMQLKKLAEDSGVDLKDKKALKELGMKHNIFFNTEARVISITRDQINNLLKDFLIITRNNDLIVKHKIKRGVVAEWSGFFFNRRKEFKKEKAILEKKIYDKVITDENEIKTTEIEIQNLDNIQQSTKIRLNSVYGMLGTKFSPIFDPDLSQAICRQGKFANKNSSLYMKKFYMDEYGVSPDYIQTVSGDTDSQFSNFSCVIESWAKKYNLPKRLAEWPDEKKLELWDYAEKFVDERLTPFVRDLVREWCHTDEPDPLRYGLEYLADVGIYIAKKCYSVHKIVLEGRELADKIVYKGIELKKGNLSVEVKNILSPIFKKVLTTDYKEEDFKQYLYDSYEKFCTLNVDEISFWKGYNTEREAEGFLEMKKIVNEDGRTISTTSISAACAFYNQLLQKLNIGDKYESILLGDKVRFCYVKSNEFPIKYIAYKGRFPTEFYKYMAVDYDTMFDKTVMAPLKGLIKACKYNNIDPKKRIAESIDDW